MNAALYADEILARKKKAEECTKRFKALHKKTGQKFQNATAAKTGIDKAVVSRSMTGKTVAQWETLKKLDTALRRLERKYGLESPEILIIPKVKK